MALARFPGTVELDAWECAHLCELNGTPGLSPPVGPEARNVRRLLTYALTHMRVSTANASSLIDLSLRCLKLDQTTTVLVRCATSSHVYDEYRRLPALKKGLFVAALEGLNSHVKPYIHRCFTGDLDSPAMQALCTAFRVCFFFFSSK